MNEPKRLSLERAKGLAVNVLLDAEERRRKERECELLAQDARKMQDAAERERLIDEQWKIWDRLEKENEAR